MDAYLLIHPDLATLGILASASPLLAGLAGIDEIPLGECIDRKDLAAVLADVVEHGEIEIDATCRVLWEHAEQDWLIPASDLMVEVA